MRRLVPLLVVIVVTLSGCSFLNPVGLTRRADRVFAESTCVDRGISAVALYLQPADREEEVDFDQPMYRIAAPVDDEGRATEGVQMVAFEEPPPGWTVEGGMTFVSMATEVVVAIEYEDAEGETTQLRFEQIVPGLVWLGDQNVSRVEFDETLRTCDPGIELDGWMRTLLLFTGLVAVAAVAIAPLLFFGSLGREALQQRGR